MKHKHLFIFGAVAVVVWALGTCAFLYLTPQGFYNTVNRAIVKQGFGMKAGGIPANTLYTFPALASPTLSKNPFVLTGNRDTLYTVGALDLSKGPQVLHIPDMAGRYYQIEFVDPSVDIFADIVKRPAADYLISGPHWNGVSPAGLTKIVSPNNSVVVIARVLVEGDSNVPAVHSVSTRIELKPLSQ